MARAPSVWIGLLVLAGAAPDAAARAVEPPAEISDKVAAARTAERVEAIGVLRRASDFLAKQAHFAFTADLSFDAVQPTGLALEFGATNRATVRRPDRLRVESRERNGSLRLLLFDGETIMVSLPDERAYASVARSGPVHEALDYLVAELDTPAPLADLAYPELLDEALEARIRHAFVVGEEEIDGSPSTHLALRGEDVDVQMWIERGDRPLLRRLVITYPHARGRPSFRAQLRDWDLAPDVSDARFRVDPPAGSERIPFAPRPAAPAEAR